MSSDSSTQTSPNSNDMARQQRRGSVTSSAFTNLFRSGSISQPPAPVFPTPLTSTMNDPRRRLSVTTFGLSGTSPTTPSAFLRRASLSTNSDSIDENAVEEDEGSRTAPVTPFTRRMSFGAAQAARSAGPRGASSPGTNDQGFNWSDQLRSRAESTVVSGPRPSFSFASGLSASPPRAGPPPAPVSPRHDRAKSVSDMPAPPAQPPRARAPQKPDPFQERILKGDFYMD
ncbi:hypothetical protein MFIFM68171_01008 [Madurella fahalii]|uniref:Uncharacterized protein n=1 Tax=Madurella fahalii TaxID=1157608 RepID=A0ABQ0FZ94_9PEZI